MSSLDDLVDLPLHFSMSSLVAIGIGGEFALQGCCKSNIKIKHMTHFAHSESILLMLVLLLFLFLLKWIATDENWHI